MFRQRDIIWSQPLEEENNCPLCEKAVTTDYTKEAHNYMKPAGFWIRCLAFFIDALILSPFLIISFYNIYQIKSFYLAVTITIPWLIYQPYMESRFGATLGKKTFGISVIDSRGNYLSLLRAYVRHLPNLVVTVLGIVSNYYLYKFPGFEHVTSFESFKSLHFKSPVVYLSFAVTWFMYIDYLTVVFNRKKRAIHDFMAGSYCVRKKQTS